MHLVLTSPRSTEKVIIRNDYGMSVNSLAFSNSSLPVHHGTTVDRGTELLLLLTSER